MSFLLTPVSFDCAWLSMRMFPSFPVCLKLWRGGGRRSKRSWNKESYPTQYLLVFASGSVTNCVPFHSLRAFVFSEWFYTLFMRASLCTVTCMAFMQWCARLAYVNIIQHVIQGELCKGSSLLGRSPPVMGPLEDYSLHLYQGKYTCV